MTAASGRSSCGLASVLQCRDRGLQHVEIQRQADLVHFAALRFAQEFARTADLQIVRGQHEAGAELLERLDGFEASRRILRQRLARRHEQVRIGAMMRAADAAAQLVQLRQTQPVGEIDHDGVGRGHVDAALDDRRAQQQVEAAVIEIHHQLLELALAHLAVADAYLGFGQQLLQIRGDLLDGLDLVVHEIDLATAAQFAQGRFADGRRLPFAKRRC